MKQIIHCLFIDGVFQVWWMTLVIHKQNKIVNLFIFDFVFIVCKFILYMNVEILSWFTFFADLILEFDYQIELELCLQADIMFRTQQALILLYGKSRHKSQFLTDWVRIREIIAQIHCCSVLILRTQYLLTAKCIFLSNI